MLAATVSGPPDGLNCVGGAIVHYYSDGRAYRRAAFWRLGRTQPMLTRSPFPFLNEDYEDIMWHNGAFHLLLSSECVNVFVLQLTEHGDGISFENGLIMMVDARHFNNEVIIGRYILVSRGELLLVLRISGDSDSFRVFQLKELDTPRGLTTHEWTELEDLDERVLFVGKGSGRSYEKSEFPGFGEGGFLFFLDDEYLNDVPRSVVMNGPYRGLITGCWRIRKSTRRDIEMVDGHWKVKVLFDKCIEYVFLDQYYARHSPPVWCLP
uniref:KIB1-4 beta-propeller domain-containing protein n=2 Tax=Aegilops tauschii subsp. strangulata TaxID=200361 RepID=A0A453JUQ7_AEGTS|nr:uncharacterized protein LOC120964363 [Aegilops tauschii subsp. strangulata]